MDRVTWVFAVACLGAGLALLIGGLVKAKWWMVDDTDWWMIDTRKTIKRFFGDAGLRWFGVVFGSGITILVLFALVSNLWRLLRGAP